MSDIVVYYQMNMPCGFIVEGNKKKIQIVEKLHKMKCELCSFKKNINMKNYKDNKVNDDLKTELINSLDISKRGNLVKAKSNIK